MDKIFGTASTPGPSSGDGSNKKSVKKPCRACHDFKSWAQMQGSEFASARKTNENEPSGADAECPLDKDQLGRNTWSLLHTMAAYYPDDPSVKQQKEMSVFMKLFSKYYPCDHCAKDFRKSIVKSPPETKSRWEFSQWLCRMHNEVNRKLGKEEFDCSLIDKRWESGWDDGSCG